MSRFAKKYHQEKILGTEQDRNVRLFAFSNTRPGYQVCFSPESPILILKTKKPKKANEHPCKQWEGFSSLVFNAAPNTTHAVYLADTSMLEGPQYEREETVNGSAVGPLLKRLSNVIAKLNPHNGTLVAAGVSALLALKYVLVGEKQLGHRDRLMQKVVLVLPTSLVDCQNLVREVLRLRELKADSYPLPEVVVLLGDETDVSPEWIEWLSAVEVEGPLFAKWCVSTDLQPSVFDAVMRHAGVIEDETPLDLATHFSKPLLYRIDFLLSSQTKFVEQVVQLCALDADLPTRAEKHLASHDCTYRQQADTSITTGKDVSDTKNHCDQDLDKDRRPFFGLAGLEHATDSQEIFVEGRILDLGRGILGTTEGQVIVDGLEACIRDTAPDLSKRISSDGLKGLAVELTASLVRDGVGRTYLHPHALHALTTKEVEDSLTVGDSVESLPSYNISGIAYNYGGILIRGRKCALVRSFFDQNSPDKMSFPYVPALSSETATECAIRAVCEGCDVSSDNFYLPSYLPPVVYYEREDQPPRCVMLYIMFAVEPSPRGIDGDRFEDKPDPEEPYDWVSYGRARTLLSTEAEREVLMEVKHAIRKVAMADIYHNFPNYGFFGDSTEDILAPSMKQT